MNNYTIAYNTVCQKTIGLSKVMSAVRIVFQVLMVLDVFWLRSLSVYCECQKAFSIGNNYQKEKTHKHKSAHAYQDHVSVPVVFC